MSNKKLIITTDDFGPMPAINEGVNTLVASGKVNSVNVLMNYKGEGGFKSSAENVGGLLNAARVAKGNNPDYKLDIGCHFTITSGEPMCTQIDQAKFKSQRDCLLDSAGNFRKYTDMRRAKDGDRDKMAELISIELKAQQKALEDAISEHSNGNDYFKVNYFNSHHNSLNMWPEFFQPLLALAISGGQKIPLRTPKVYPNKKGSAYLFMIKLRHSEDLNYADRHKITSYHQEIISDFFKPEGTDPHPSTIHVDGRHYGPLVGKVMLHKKRIRRKHKKLNKIKSNMKDNQPIELLLHVAHSHPSHQMEEIGYTGINPKYITGRKAEFDSIRLYKGFKDVSLVSWDEL